MGPRRHLWPIPALGALAGLAAKKLAFHALVRNVGARRILDEAKRLNASMRDANRPEAKAAHDALERKLAEAERAIDALQGDARVQRAWDWYRSLEREKPELTSALVKTLLDSLGPVKWANALLRDKTTRPKV